jgi:hypothetical protein
MLIVCGVSFGEVRVFECGRLDVDDTVYVLNNDIDALEGGCFVVDGNNIVFDGDGRDVSFIDDVIVIKGRGNVVKNFGFYKPNALYEGMSYPIKLKGEGNIIEDNYFNLFTSSIGNNRMIYGVEVSGSDFVIRNNTFDSFGIGTVRNVNVDSGGAWGKIIGNVFNISNLGKDGGTRSAHIYVGKKSDDELIVIGGNEFFIKGDAYEVQGVQIYDSELVNVIGNEFTDYASHSRQIVVDKSNDVNLWNNEIYMRGDSNGGVSSGIRVRLGS